MPRDFGASCFSIPPALSLKKARESTCTSEQETSVAIATLTYNTTVILLCRMYVDHRLKGRQYANSEDLQCTNYCINNVTLPIECRNHSNLSLSLYQRKGPTLTPKPAKKPTTRPLPAIMHRMCNGINMSPPLAHGIGSSSDVRLSDLPDYQVRRYHLSVAAVKGAK